MRQNTTFICQIVTVIVFFISFKAIREVSDAGKRQNL